MSNFHLLTGQFKKSTTDKKGRSNQFVCLRMVLYTRVNGWQMKIRKMVAGYKFGQMVQGTMDSGETGWRMDMEDSFMPKVMCMRGNGLKIRLMGMEFTLILMAVDMKDNGSKINSMDSV